MGVVNVSMSTELLLSMYLPLILLVEHCSHDLGNGSIIIKNGGQWRREKKERRALAFAQVQSIKDSTGSHLLHSFRAPGIRVRTGVPCESQPGPQEAKETG